MTRVRWRAWRCSGAGRPDPPAAFRRRGPSHGDTGSFRSVVCKNLYLSTPILAATGCLAHAAGAGASRPQRRPIGHRREHGPMSLAFATERRRLTEEELEPIQRSHFPLLEGLSRDEVQELLRWLRARRDRARDLMRSHRRSKRGKGGAAATPLPDADRGPPAQKQGFPRA